MLGLLQRLKTFEDIKLSLSLNSLRSITSLSIFWIHWWVWYENYNQLVSVMFKIKVKVLVNNSFSWTCNRNFLVLISFNFKCLSANLKVLTTSCFIVHLLSSCGPSFSICLGCNGWYPVGWLSCWSVEMGTFSKGVQVSFGGLYFHCHSNSSF